MRGKVKIFRVILVLITLGCAPMVWERPGTTPSEFNKDSYECERDARLIGYYGAGLDGERSSLNSDPVQQGFDKLSQNLSAYAEMKELFKRCMGSKGYTLRK
jgi:hypothetical protein